jgi:hypothetical protein
MWSAALADTIDLGGERITMTDATSDRRADRFPIPLKVYYSFDRVEGIASLVNISYTGALLENTAMRPEIGTRIQLYLHLKPPCASEASKPSELAGIVIRHSSDGFGVVFEDNQDPDVRRVVDDAAALVATRR